MYQRGDVVLCRVPMPSTGLAHFKVRPAIVVSKDANNRRLTDVIVAPCTSNVARHAEPTQYLIDGPEIAAAGIRVPSDHAQDIDRPESGAAVGCRDEDS